MPGISRSSYQRILAAGELRPHRVRGWLHSPDPQFREKVTAITELYLHPPAGTVVLSIDEKTGMQALERRFPDRPAAPGRPGRREFEYTRHGTQSLLCAFEVHRGRVVGDCGDTRTAADLVRFMETVAGQYPAGPVHVIWDCLNIHFDGIEQRWTAFNARHGHRFVFHYTPKHASWVNQVELFFSILQRQCLRPGSFRSTAELRTAVLAFLAAWNRDRAHPFRWTFTGYPLQAGARPASGRGRVRGSPRGGEQANAWTPAYPGRRRRTASGDPRPRRLRARVGPGGSGPPDICVDDGAPVARATPLGAGQFGLSFHTHTGRWEPMPVVADLTRLAHDLVGLLGPYLQRWDFPDRNSGSDH